MIQSFRNSIPKSMHNTIAIGIKGIFRTILLDDTENIPNIPKIILWNPHAREYFRKNKSVNLSHPPFIIFHSPLNMPSSTI